MKNDKISNELETIRQILLIVLQSYEFSSYLYSPRTESEKEFADNSYFINLTRHIYWRNLIIEFAKLITDSDNQQFNIFKLLRKIKSKEYFGELRLEVSKIDNWKNLLDAKEKSIKKIKILRNKIYSHTDRNKEQYTNSDITFEEIKTLIDLLKSIIKSIFADLLDTEVELQPLTTTDENFKILKVLADEKERRRNSLVKTFIEKANKKNERYENPNLILISASGVREMRMVEVCI